MDPFAISSSAHARMQDWAAEKPTLGLMGEFSAGKSTLANFLLGQSLLPENVTATILPVVWVTYGESVKAEGLRFDGTLERIDLGSLGPDVRDHYITLRLTAPATFLKDTDLVDTPGLSDPTLRKGATLFLGAYLDAVIWCTSVIQAWRKTEKTAWLQFPEPLRRRSLVILTRADKVRRDSDLKKVMRRVSTETQHLFGNVLPLNTPGAIAALAGNGAEDLWATSGGAAVTTALQRTIHEIATEKQALEPVEDVAPVQLAPQTDQKITHEVTEIADETDLALPVAFRSLCVEAGPIHSLSQALSLFHQFKSNILGHPRLSPAHRATLEICLTAGDEGSVDVTRLIAQVESELSDFGSTNRVQLSAPLPGY